MERYEKGELAKEILKGFLLGGFVVSAAICPGIAHLYKFTGATSARERWRVKQSVARLRKNGLLIRRIKNGKEEYLITKSGEKQLAHYLTEDLHIKKPQKWDKKWRVLMFDIPETKARTRREVSFKIKDIGMKTIQNSVFISPYPCKKEIDFIAQYYFVKKYFIYIETDNIECADDLLKYFKL